MSDANPVPQKALDDRLGFVGTAGSGKTYGTGVLVEKLLAAKRRTVIPDPLGVWWGLRAAPDGKGAGFPITIFGGPHGDLPITPHSGALIGETVAGMAESSILDLSQLGSKAAERRFMLAFLEALYRRVTGEPVHLVFDEADMWAPQRLLDKEGEAAKLLGMMETIVRRGRVKGFIPWLITQRPAVLSKDVLSQVDGLVIFKLTSSQDRDAVGDWVEGQADKGQWKQIHGELAGKERGHALVWLPGHGVLTPDVLFPKKATYDSSATPKRGEKIRATTLKPLDVGALKEKLASIEAETKANDPRALRAELAALKKQLRGSAGGKHGETPNPEVIAAAAVARGAAGARKVMSAEIAAAERHGRQSGAEALQTTLGALDAIEASAIALVDQVKAVKRDITQRRVSLNKAVLTYKSTSPAEGAAPAPFATISMPRPTAAAQPRPMAAAPQGGGPGQRILDALATLKQMGHERPSNAQVAWLARYSPVSTSYTNPRGALKSEGLIEYPEAGRVALTREGDGRAAPVQIDGSLAEFVLAQLPGPEARILRAALAAFPEAATNEQIAQAANYSASSTSYTNPRGSLKTKELIEYPSPGMVRAAEWLLP